MRQDVHQAKATICSHLNQVSEWSKPTSGWDVFMSAAFINHLNILPVTPPSHGCRCTLLGPGSSYAAHKTHLTEVLRRI